MILILANKLCAGGLLALLILVRWIFSEHGWGGGMWFCTGGIVSTVIWQCAYHCRYGHWFDPPVINGDINAPALRPGAPSSVARGGNARPIKDVPFIR